MQLDLPLEMPDLRKSPYKEAPADPLPYVRKSRPRMVTADLPLGTQAAFIAAAETAAALSAPLNRFLTIRWSSLFSDGDVNPLRVLPTAERIDYLVELLRKWLVRNALPPFYIWVRENADDAGEHLHMIFHSKNRLDSALRAFVEKRTGERKARAIPSAEKSEGEIARGEASSWHLARDRRPERAGFYLAAYLGKGEPSERLFRKKLVGNAKKPVRGMSFGGTYKDGKYDITQGRIEGTESRLKRFFIANELKRKAGLTTKKKTSGRASSASQFHGKSHGSAAVTMTMTENPQP